MEQFVNRVWATLSVGIDNVTTSLTLTSGHGARFGTLTAGNKIRIAMLDAVNNVTEIMYITAIAGDVLTVVRGQDGSTATAIASGTRIEHRVGKSTLEAFIQKATSSTGNVATVRNGTTDAAVQLNGTDALVINDAGIAAKSFSGASGVLTDAASIAWNLANGDAAEVTLGAAGRTLANPTNLKKGSYILIVKQDATGNRTITTWGSAYKFPSGVKPVLSTAANAVDLISFYCDGTNMYGSYIRGLA